MTTDDELRRLQEALEHAMTTLSLATEYAGLLGRAQFATSIAAVVRQIEDLRQRTEEFDPAQLDPMYPAIIRAAGEPRATRVAIARDASSAIYKRLDGSGGPWRSPYYRIYPYTPGSVVARVREAAAVDLRTLPDPDKYAWDAPEELAATAPRIGAGRAAE